MCVFPHVFLNSPDPINIPFVNLSAAFLNKTVFPNVILQMIITDTEKNQKLFWPSNNPEKPLNWAHDR